MKLPLREKIAYGLGDTASNLIFMTVLNFLLFYYTDVFGLTAAAAGTLLLVVQVIDAFVDIFVGIAADRTQTRWGKFRPWLLWMAAPLAIIGVLTFTTPAWSPGMKLAYASLTYLLLMVTYSMVNVPFGALSGVMTNDNHERASLSGVRLAFAQVGGLIVSMGTLPMVRYFSGSAGDRASGFQHTMMVFGTVAFVLLLITFGGTTERIQPPSTQHHDLGADLAMLKKNTPWIVLTGATIGMFLFLSARVSMVVYYFKYYVGQESGATLFFSIISLAAIPGALLSAPLARRFGNRGVFQVGIAASAVFGGAIYFVPAGDNWLLEILNALSAGALFLVAPLTFAMLGDTADFGEWKFRRRSTGIIFSGGSFAAKVGMGLGAALAGGLLTSFGYVAGTAQNQSTVRGIVLLITVIPAAGYFAIAGLMRLYSLDETTFAIMRAELDARRRLEAPGEA